MLWCISNISFAILINGSLLTFFKTSSGLRQDDPLSPLLFIIVMEAFHSLVERANELE